VSGTQAGGVTEPLRLAALVALLGLALLGAQHERRGGQHEHEGAEDSDLDDRVGEPLVLADEVGASTDSTMISLIEAIIPTTRNGSATTSRLPRMTRTAKSSSTTMKTSSRVSSTSRTSSVVSASPPSSVSPRPAATSRARAATARTAAMPT
jgi:hypothetical protein